MFCLQSTRCLGDRGLGYLGLLFISLPGFVNRSPFPLTNSISKYLFNLYTHHLIFHCEDDV